MNGKRARAGWAMLRAAHLGPTVTVTAIVTALALGAGRWRSAPVMAAAVLAGQLSVGWSNDLIDRRRDRCAGRIDKPLATGALDAGAVRRAAGAALIACVPLSLAVGRWAGAVHLGAVAAGWAYNAGLKATAASVVPYAIAFGAVPAFVSLAGSDPAAPPAWVVLAAAALGSGAHFLNALPDLADDRRLGVEGLPQRLGADGSLAAGAGLMAGCIVVVAIALSAGGGATAAWTVAALGVASTMLIGMVALAALGARRAAWHGAMATSAAVTAAFVLGGASALS
ncbi:MAG: UbiA family prenyltransferase [Acidimicrobiales bacterium]